MRGFVAELVDAPIKLTARDFFDVDFKFLRDVSYTRHRLEKIIDN
jgi:hypothetical protein